MNTISNFRRGFTLIEILVAIGILGVIFSIGVVSLSSYKSIKVVEVTANEIAFKLEEAKSNSLAGKNGSAFGIKFASTSYTYFQGPTYNQAGTSNISPSFPSDLEIVTNLTGGETELIFARINGKPNISGTVTIRKTSDISKTKTITIGVLGDISVVQ